VTGTNSNYNPQQWAAHLAQQAEAQRRHSALLQRQAANDPNRK
jgi:hypothetical protein